MNDSSDDDVVRRNDAVRATERSMRHWMTPAPRSVGDDQPLSAAQRIMTENGASTLPVVANGKLVGILTERDIRHLLRAMPGVDAASMFAADVMTPYVLASPDEAVRSVVIRMAEQKLDGAVVYEDGAVIGTFTAMGALDFLARQLPVGR